MVVSSVGADAQAGTWLLQLQRLLDPAAAETTEQAGAAQLWGDALPRTHWGRCSCLFQPLTLVGRVLQLGQIEMPSRAPP